MVSQLDAEIEILEREIAHLRDQADQWRTAVGSKLRGAISGGGKRRGRPPGSGHGPQKSARVSWDEVLASVPKRFGVQDVLKHPGAAAKGRAQVYPALNRWEATNQIKRVEKGVYEKAGGATGGTAAPTRKRTVAKKK